MKLTPYSKKTTDFMSGVPILTWYSLAVGEVRLVACGHAAALAWRDASGAVGAAR